MSKIQITQYSQFVDVQTGVAFTPVPDRKTGRYVGVAEVSDSDALLFEDRLGFHVLTDAEFLAMINPPVITPSIAITAATPQAPQPPDDSARKK